MESAKGALELERTREILLRSLPPVPAVVADIGGGPGRYALWLADLGYRVEHRDLMALHVEQLLSVGRDDIRTAVAIARAIERVPVLLGLSAHLLCTARRPAASPPGAGRSLRLSQAPATVGAVGSTASFAVSR